MYPVTPELLADLTHGAAECFEEGLLRLTDRGPELDWSSNWFAPCEAALVVAGFVVGRLVELERQEGDGAAFCALRDVPPDPLRLLLAEGVATLVAQGA